jgi:hypothetical protein
VHQLLSLCNKPFLFFHNVTSFAINITAWTEMCTEYFHFWLSMLRGRHLRDAECPLAFSTQYGSQEPVINNKAHVYTILLRPVCVSGRVRINGAPTPRAGPHRIFSSHKQSLTDVFWVRNFSGLSHFVRKTSPMVPSCPYMWIWPHRRRKMSSGYQIYVIFFHEIT